MPISFSQEAEPIQKLSCLEKKVTTMQGQLAQLVLAVLQERPLRYDQQIMALELAAGFLR
jgi:hypothetical protein